MKKNYILSIIKKHSKAAIFSLFLLFSLFGHAQTPTNVTIPSGSFIVNMGVVPQTVANGMKPFGLIYDLLKNYKTPIDWVIKTGKVQDQADFTYNGVDYKGGPFIIRAEYRTPAVNARIAAWQALGVVGVTTTSPVTVSVYLTFWNAPKWTMDLQNGSLAVSFFNYAGIPSTAYGGASSNWKTPAQIDCCNDIFVMPHADPTWSTHRYLYDFVTGYGSPTGCRSGVWLGCHAGSALMNMFDNITTDGDPIDNTQQANFLVGKTGTAVGAGPYAAAPGNSLLLWGNHSDGTPPYSFNNSDKPIMQFMKPIDAALQNGSEQIYIPVAGSGGWYPTTLVGVYDPDHPQRANDEPAYRAAALAVGPAFGVVGNGKVMLEAGHNISGTGAANVAAMRAFFNYSFLVAWEKSVLPEIKDLPNVLISGLAYGIGYDLLAVLPPAPTQTYTTKWSSSCGGTFLPSATANPVTFIPPVAINPLNCNITVEITDGCGRTTFDTHPTTVQCDLQVATTLKNPCYGSSTEGAITMTFINGSGPYNYVWTKSGGGTGSGTLTTAPYSITGLSAGTYNITATSSGGAGCPVSFSVTLTESPQIIITATPVAVSCPGGSNGAINVSVSGGIPGYTYSWTGPNSFAATTQSINSLTAGTYNLIVTDSKGCSALTSVNVTQPNALTITPTVTTVNCFGGNTGAITLAVSGGTAPYTYLWNSGAITQNRTSLVAGTYSVAVTDANNCTLSSANIVVSQPSAALALSETHVNVLCNGASTGSIDLTVSGGTAVYSYAWTGPGGYTATTEDLTGRPAGTYNVVVTDSKGCVSNLSVVITQPVAMAISSVVKQPTCPPLASQNYSDGTITLTVTGGTPFAGGPPYYTYSWTGPNNYTSTSKDISGLISGTYSVTVTDSNGCTKSASVTLNYLNPILPPPGLITK